MGFVHYEVTLDLSQFQLRFMTEGWSDQRRSLALGLHILILGTILRSLGKSLCSGLIFIYDHNLEGIAIESRYPCIVNMFLFEQLQQCMRIKETG